MARERWFYAHDEVRHGPHGFPELVDALLALPEPRTRLVWSRGMENWARAGRVPRLAEAMARQLPAPTPVPAPPVATPRPPLAAPTRPLPAPAPAPPPVAAAPGVPRSAVLAGGALLLAIAAGAIYLALQRAPAEPGSQALPDAGVGSESGPAPGGATGAAPGAVAQIGWAAAESEVPAGEIALLKGVAAWEDDELTVTLYNGSRWKITEILVRTSVLEGDQFVDSALVHPLVLREEVDAGVAPILDRVAPDRRRPSLNPDDTRPFAGKAGQKPRAYRWRIEGALGYAPVLR